MLAYEEYVVSGRPHEVLAALRESAVSLGWRVEEDHPDRLFCLEDRVGVPLEPRKLAVLVEEYRLESKVILVAWCAGFSVRRYDGKSGLMKSLPYKSVPLAKREAAAEPVPLGSPATNARMPSWVRQVRSAEFGLLFLGFAPIVLFVVAVRQHFPVWSVVVSVAVAAIASFLSGLSLDFLARRALKIASRQGMAAQLRRAGFSAAVAVVLLLWLWRM
jgi:hypothetical protein